MEIIDVILLLPLLWGFYQGFKNGLIKELISFFALIIGIYAAFQFSNLLVPIIDGKVKSEYLNTTAFIVMFIGVVVGLILLGKVIDKVATALMLGMLNKIAGGIFGLAKFMLIISMLISVVIKFDKKNQIFNNSKLKSPVLSFYLEVHNIISPSINSIDYDKIKKAIDVSSDSLSVSNEKDTIPL
ncbi:MAG: CvpA family protein [Bacteroidota bacterium]